MACGCKKADDFDLTLLEPVYQEYAGKAGSLIPILQKAQNIFGYLPKVVMQNIAARLRISEGDIFGVVTFYSQFHMKPRGRNIIRVCQGTACHVRGAGTVLQTLSDTLGIKPGETTDELDFMLETVACLGACGLAPVMIVNSDTHGRLSPQDVPAILEPYSKNT